MIRNTNDEDQVKQEGKRDDGAEFSFSDAIAFNSQALHDITSISDDEIRQQYGDEIDVEAVREAFRKNTFNRASGNPRISARAKLRRRLLWLQAAISDVEAAIEAVFEAPGRTNKADKLENLRNSIAEFRAHTGLVGDGRPGIVNAEFSMLDKLFKLPASGSQADE